MNNFNKLYGMPCPVEANLPYYLKCLRDTTYSYLVSEHSLWQRLVSKVAASGVFESDLPLMVDSEVRAFESGLIHELSSMEVGARVAAVLRTPTHHVQVYDRRCEFLNRTMVSVDIAEANYQTTYFAIPGLPRTWRQFVGNFVTRTNRSEEFRCLSGAKLLRQRIFGKVVGGSMTSRQLYQVELLRTQLVKVFRDAPVQVSHDELTYLLEGPRQLDELVDACENHGWSWRHEIFDLSKCRWGGYVKKGEDRSVKLFSVPASRFYYVLANVLGREVTYLDRAFTSEGYLARWSE